MFGDIAHFVQSSSKFTTPKIWTFFPQKHKNAHLTNSWFVHCPWLIQIQKDTKDPNYEIYVNYETAVHILLADAAHRWFVLVALFQSLKIEQLSTAQPLQITQKCGYILVCSERKWVHHFELIICDFWLLYMFWPKNTSHSSNHRKLHRTARSISLLTRGHHSQHFHHDGVDEGQFRFVAQMNLSRSPDDVIDLWRSVQGSVCVSACVCVCLCV